MLSFIFNGKDSYLDYGLYISKRPVIPSPKKRVEYIDILGKHSRLIYDEGTFEDITITLECSIKSRENLIGKIDEIKAWLLSVGEANLIFSFMPDKCYKAQVVNAIDFKQVYRYTSKFPIIFNCRPFKYLVQNNILTINESSTFITNPGTIESEPIITVYGTGDISLTINEKLVELIDVPSKIILNTIIYDAYDDNKNSLNEKMKGEFPNLIPGVNEISYIGEVEKIEILPNWRWL